MPKIQDNLFASLLNEEAMVKIGQTLYRVTDDYTFSVVDKDNRMLKQFRENAASLEKLSQVNKFENIDYLAGKTLVMEDEQGREIARFQGSSERSWPKPGSSQFRAEIGAWSRTYGLYSSVGVKIETQSYRRGGVFGKKRWRSRDSNYLYCYGRAETKECIGGPCSPVFNPSGSNSRSGNRCERTIAQAGGTGAWHVTNWIDGRYRVRYEAGETIHETTFRFE